MNAEELKNIKERLEKTIQTLESQTNTLKNDLNLIKEYLAKPDQEKNSQGEQFVNELKEQAHNTENQIEINQGLLQKLKSTQTESTDSKDYYDRLGEEAISLLQRMKDKVSQQEILSELYRTVTPASKESDKEEKTKEEPQAPPSDPKADLEFEKKLQKFEEEDALAALKKKMGIK
ncbi:hypothetical protein AAG747_18265 [Rapidithrix thailandica]|uniref:Uncharacterized protein n=1 Tax=Rapidithrix thailandica TaxID=413964 RepID=A0AAW9SGP9_9BACT